VAFGRNTEWRFLVTDLDGRHVTTLDAHARDRSIEYELNAPTVIRGTMSSDSTEINRLDLDGFPYLAEGDRLLYCFRRDYDGDFNSDPFVIRAAGIILQYDDAAGTEEASTTFTAFDPWEYISHLPIVNPTFPERSDLDIKYTDTQVQLIIEDILFRAFLQYNLSWSPDSAVANMFLDWGQTGEYVQDWDVLPEITHTFQKGTTVAEAFRQLVDRGRVDIMFMPIYDPVNRPGYLAEVHVFDVAGAQRPEAIFAWDKPSHSLAEISRLVDGTRRANKVRWHTWLGGDAGPTQSSALSVDRFGEYWSDQTIVSSEHTGQTSDYQNAFLETFAEHAREVTLTTIPERCPEPFLEWYLGDEVRVFASPNLRAEMSGFQRVSGFTIDISDDSVETVSNLRIYIPSESVEQLIEQPLGLNAAVATLVQPQRHRTDSILRPPVVVG
jgi:hypothetical protein